MSVLEHHAKSVFFAALERSADDWPAFLQEACGGDVAVRRRVEQLLNAHAEMGAVGGDTVEPAATLREPAVAECTGMTIGPYQLLEQLGEGGFGVVFLAEQSQPVRRKVALKVLKPGMDTAQVVARFEAERQALALMDHPHIAQVFDGGATPSGRPYFVMELVRGLPITELCDQRRLPVRERLELFIAVCQGVQHAHQKGIIHRDLKPSNVLVTMDGATPRPKVIDFGVAKAQGQSLTDKTLFTTFAQLLGTPMYMSPEQAGQSGLDVDTRSDVYSLGVLLYELLAGATPFVKERFKVATYDEIRHILRDEEPPCPSARLSTSPETLPALAAQRQTEPAQLTKLIRGELDWIVMKSLEKDRDRRYASPAEFAADVQRFLRHEPVLAGPASRWYRLRKVLRRHRAPVLAGTSVLLALVGGIIGTTLGMLRARDAEVAAKAERTAALVARNAESVARQDSDVAHGRTRAALDLLTDRMIGNVLDRQRQLGADEQRFLRDIEKHYQAWADAQGDTPVVRALQANGARRVAQIRLQLSDLVGAEHCCRRAIALYAELQRDTPVAAGIEVRRELARTHHDLGQSLFDQGRIHDAIEAQRTALAMWREWERDAELVAAERMELAWVQASLGAALRQAGHFAEAETTLRDVLARHTPAVADAAPSVAERYLAATAANTLGATLRDQDRIPETDAAYRQSLALWDQLAQELPNHTGILVSREGALDGIAKLRIAQSRPREAEPLLREIVAARRRRAARAPNDPGTQASFGYSLKSLGGALVRMDKLNDAEQVYRAGADVYARIANSPHATPERLEDYAETLAGLASVYATQRRWSDARRTVQQSLAVLAPVLASGPRQPIYQGTLLRALRTAIELPIEPGGHAAAAAEAERLAAVEIAAPRDLARAAWRLAQCAKHVALDEKLPTESRWPRAFHYALRSGELAPQSSLRQIEWWLFGKYRTTTSAAEPDIAP